MKETQTLIQQNDVYKEAEGLIHKLSLGLVDSKKPFEDIKNLYLNVLDTQGRDFDEQFFHKTIDDVLIDNYNYYTDKFCSKEVGKYKAFRDFLYEIGEVETNPGLIIKSFNEVRDYE